LHFAQFLRHVPGALVALLGLFASARSTMRSNPTGSCGSSERSGGCGSPAMRFMIWNTEVSPGRSNGEPPVSIS